MHEKPKRYLFICSANRNRSKAAEEICRQLAARKNTCVECFSAGVDSLATVRVTKKMANKADLIFVMEEYMGELLQFHLAQDPKKLICLDIPDIYSRFDPKLEAMINRKLKRYL